MDLLKSSILPVLFSGLLAVVISAAISYWLHRRFVSLSVKRDVLRQFVGNSYILTKPTIGHIGEPFVSLNQIYVVYAEDEQVIRALRKLHEELTTVPESLIGNILQLIKAMVKAAEVPWSELNEEFIRRPFSPPAKN